MNSAQAARKVAGKAFTAAWTGQSLSTENRIVQTSPYVDDTIGQEIPVGIIFMGKTASASVQAEDWITKGFNWKKP